LLPLAEKPEHWTRPEIYRSGLKVKFLPHYNKAHQASITKSFASERFQRRHLAAVNRLGDIPLCIDRWTLELVDHYGVRKDTGQQVDRIVAEAARLLRRDAFWNSYHIDSRGRLYADQDFNYARHDSVRSLYRFAHGAELGADGFRWLLIHAANCYGQDKRSFNGRVAWAELNHSDIERVAKDPRGTFDWWSKADKPFAFAAACRELVLANDNPGFKTHLPVGFDHTASGIQHLALIGRDTQAAKLVNLVDCAAPSDIYAALAKRAQELFDSNHWADYWCDYFKQLGAGNIRKLLKAPGVSFSYAATERGNVRQIYEAHYDLCEDAEPPPWAAVVYLVDKFRQACAEMLPGPVATMQYIQSLVKDCNSAERFLEWPTPSGLHVSNLYPKLNKPTIYLPDGTEYTVAGIIPDTIRGAKTKSSAAANYVHSLDASHLARTVNELADNEMDALCVHDCFAVRAPHATQFHITNREELALMYEKMFEEGGPLALLRARNGNIGDPPPPPGKFEIGKNVQAATYACS
jgi:DNA-directed RNA polymerase, mitochondrial